MKLSIAVDDLPRSFHETVPQSPTFPACDESVALAAPITLGPAQARHHHQFEHQLEADRLIDRSVEYTTAAASTVRLHGLAADVLDAWRDSLDAGDFASANRLVVLARAIHAADRSYDSRMIG